MNARELKKRLRDLRVEEADLEAKLAQGRPLETVVICGGSISLCRQSMLRDVRKEIRQLVKESRP